MWVHLTSNLDVSAERFGHSKVSELNDVAVFERSWTFWKFKGVRAKRFGTGLNHSALTPLNFQIAVLERSWTFWKFKGVRAKWFRPELNHSALTPLNFQVAVLERSCMFWKMLEVIPPNIQFGLQCWTIWTFKGVRAKRCRGFGTELNVLEIQRCQS